MSINFKGLSDPFPADDIEWFIGVTTNDKTKGLAIPFITARAVQSRLDEVAGPNNWKNRFIEWKTGAQLCEILIYNEETHEWVGKVDGSADTDIEEIKGGLSSAFKRSATMWGIGRYLYNLENIWVDIEKKGNSYVMTPTQTLVLPAWALPGGSGIPAVNESRKPTVQYIGSGQHVQPQQPPQQPPAQNPPSQNQKRGNLSNAQIDRAYKKGYASGQTPEQIGVWIKTKFGIADIAQLNRAQYDELCAALDTAAANVRK